MSDVPNDLRYTEDHEYLRATDKDGVYLVGITDYAQGELGDVVFLELPSEGDSFEGKASFGTIEAVKAVSDLYCPVDGEIVEVNGDLEDDPALVNRDPYGEGWMVRLRVSDPDQVAALLDADQYRRHLGE